MTTQITREPKIVFLCYSETLCGSLPLCLLLYKGVDHFLLFFSIEGTEADRCIETVSHQTLLESLGLIDLTVTSVWTTKTLCYLAMIKEAVFTHVSCQSLNFKAIRIFYGKRIYFALDL